MGDAVIGCWLLTDGWNIYLLFECYRIGRLIGENYHGQTDRQTNSNFINIDYDKSIPNIYQASLCI